MNASAMTLTMLSPSLEEERRAARRNQRAPNAKHGGQKRISSGLRAAEAQHTQHGNHGRAADTTSAALKTPSSGSGLVGPA